MSAVSRKDDAAGAAEVCVLGAVFLDARAFDRVAAVLTPEDFHDDRHRHVFASQARAINAGQSPDPVAVANDLESRGCLDAAGGFAYVLSLAEATATAVGVEAWADMVRRASVKRRVWRFASTCARLAQSATIDEADRLWDRAADLLHTSRQGVTVDRARTLAAAMAEVMARAKAVYEGQAEPAGLPTGFVDYDRRTGGLQPSWLHIFGGRPGAGKTGFAVNLALNVAAQHHGVLYCSTEVSDRDIAARAWGKWGRVNTRRLRDGMFDDASVSRLVQAGHTHLKTAGHIVVADRSGATLEYVRAQIRDFGAVPGRHPLRLVVMDHLHQMVPPSTRVSREQQIAGLTGGLLGIAKDFDVAVVALAQLNRDVERRQEKRPTMADFRDGGTIEQDANVAGILWVQRGEDESESANAPPPVRGPVTLSMLKIRDGEPGDIGLYYDREEQRFESAERES